MRDKFIFLVAVATLTFLNACQRKNEEKVISRNTMTEILIDQHILEAKVLLLKLRTDSSAKVFNSLEKELFEKYKVDKATFERSFQYYLAHPEKLDKIYEVVVDSLNVYDQNAGVAEEEEEKRIKAEAELKKRQKRLRDSIALLPQMDSLGNPLSYDSLGNLLRYDSLGNLIMMDSARMAMSDSILNVESDTAVAMPGDSMQVDSSQTKAPVKKPLARPSKKILPQQ
ncbi:hypothetical protein BFP72_10900 [Reichenbachiella sp. 5M10]|uniref:DUF4296 domain-containing protein n=1 Tax=Reichenbachiella sp. 5M10 TaxID=1889772 RepID=UPI000C1524B5|nr:DUF4296 domain-containing protein [Reichenbachiella sp. 5M10]PIB35865.1 hypothetical protein BFP72_10900 [Reichenbachiella sp. 5M10]